MAATIVGPSQRHLNIHALPDTSTHNAADAARAPCQNNVSRTARARTPWSLDSSVIRSFQVEFQCTTYPGINAYTSRIAVATRDNGSLGTLLVWE